MTYEMSYDILKIIIIYSKKLIQYGHKVSKFMLFGKVRVKTNINRGNAKNYKIIPHDSK